MACCICQENLPPKVRLNVNRSTLVCGHEMHASCLVEWLKESNTCPICRREISPPKIVHITERGATERICRFIIEMIPYLIVSIIFLFLLLACYFLWCVYKDNGFFYLLVLFISCNSIFIALSALIVNYYK
jgi:prepilin signal peptidase PulO-like enzyme (type II secretory pathway)